MQKTMVSDIHRNPMIGKKALKLSTLSLSMMCITLTHAAEQESAKKEDATPKVVKVAVTGSSIKGVAAQSASPITIVKVSELEAQGVTTVEEAINKISANQGSFVTAQNVGTSQTAGSTANLRGIGSNKTLILLNGRRLAANAFDSGVTNLNIIPLAMLERIEVLRDGASAVYGTDAIGGVINFITKKQFTGFNVSAELLKPEEKGGAERHYSAFGGFGHLEDEGYNFYGVADYRRGEEVQAKDRDISKRGGLISELGENHDSGSPFPANYSWANGSGNPYAATDCGTPYTYAASSKSCRYNFAALIAPIPQTEDLSLLGKATVKLGENFTGTAEYVFADDKVRTAISPDVFPGTVTLPSSSPYYPGNGIVPGDSNLAASGNPDLTLKLRSQAGDRVSVTENKSHRLLFAVDGTAGGWDINSGLTLALSSAADGIVSGYINNDQLQSNLSNGLLNPFGPSNDSNIWNTMGVTGDYDKASMKSGIFDVTASRSLFSLPAGDVGFAAGASARRDVWNARVIPEVANATSSVGLDPTTPESKGTRNIYSAFSELKIPLLKSLEGDLQARYDKYSDFGSTFNPKASLRWEPIEQLMFRTSYSTGFRAPTLYEEHTPKSITFTNGSYNDPVLCPGGTPTANGQEARDCNTQFYRQNGGNPNLQPEKSKSFTLGTVIQPLKNLVFTIDYYNIRVTNEINALDESAIFADPTKYAEKYVRNPDGSLNYIITTEQNLGGLHTDGIDMTAAWKSEPTAYGRFGVNLDGTYVHKYEFQTEKNGEWINNLGSYQGSGPNNGAILKWKHTLDLNWNSGNWSADATQFFHTGYVDQNPDGQDHKVSSYTIYGLSGTYKGIPHLDLTLGVKNLFNTEPPASNVTSLFQSGYDPRYSDALGRTYFIRGTYKFM